MLRARHQTDPNAAAKYRTNAKAAQEGYYTEDQEMAGWWRGKGAALLGLNGIVQTEDFRRLCFNLHPETGKPLTPRTKAKRRVGTDFTFDAPKSVSLVYEYFRDERILKAFLRAVRETMEEMERDTCTRVRKGGRDEDRKTRVLCWDELPHFTARPVNGEPDPQLHCHCFAFNATFDEVEGCWKAAQLGELWKGLPHYEAAFHSRLSKSLRDLGYEIEKHGKYFEISGISRRLIEKFSNRMKRVKDEAEKRGLTTAAEMDGLAALTREGKMKDKTRSELREIWWQRLTPEDKKAFEGIRTRLMRNPQMASTAKMSPEQVWQFLGRSDITKPPILANQSKIDHRAVAFALEHVFERASVVSEQELVTEALQWGYGEATIEGVWAAVRQFPLLRVESHGETLLTTSEILAEEKRIIREARKGKGIFPPLRAIWQIHDQRLNDQQRDAVMHILHSEDFITGISGKAGTGKTTLLHEAKRGIEDGGQRLFVFAPTTDAARGVLRGEGFDNAETVAKLLCDVELQEEARGAVWWVDEAGLMSCRAMDKLVALATRQGARLILVGDIGQHHAVERGQAFDLLQQFGKMEVANIDEIQRQKGNYKKAVEQIATRNFDGAFSTLEKMGSFQEIENPSLRQQALAAEYVALTACGETAQVTSPTHAECEEVTHAIRHALKEKNIIGEGQKWRALRNLSWTAAERSDPRRYEAGLVAQITQHVDSYALGERLEIVAVNETTVRAKTKTGKIKDIPLSEPEAFNVFKHQAIEVCPGDRIRITANGRTADRHAINNGSFHTVKGFESDGKMVLSNGWRLGTDFAHLDYGYATTSHASQGKTVDWVLVAQSGLLSSSASDANQFYVSVSRGKKGVRIYTDDIAALRENVAYTRERPMAMEIMQPNVSERLGGENDMKQAKPLESVLFDQAKTILAAPPTQEQPEKARLAKHLGKETEMRVEMPVKSAEPKKEPTILPELPKHSPTVTQLGKELDSRKLVGLPEFVKGTSERNRQPKRKPEMQAVPERKIEPIEMEMEM